ncbi:MAG: hypothetical protein HY646_19225 [Acidobacteria bacterium]|nr:hypothetical protein [Acidobacteriota bacterium]
MARSVLGVTLMLLAAIAFGQCDRTITGTITNPDGGKIAAAPMPHQYSWDTSRLAKRFKSTFAAKTIKTCHIC